MIRVTQSSAVGNSGESFVRHQFEQFLWGVSPSTGGHDVGTDFWLSVRDKRGYDLGVLLGAQVKTGSSYFSEPKHNADGELVGWWYRDKTKHADYWCDHSVPHILILHDVATRNSYWTLVTRESLISTGSSYKVLVPSSSLVDEYHLEKLIELAVAVPESCSMEGSSWVEPEIPSESQLRYALMTPRVIAPHPNQAREERSAIQAIAMLIQVRITELRRDIKDGINVLDPDLLIDAPLWEWRFFAAIYRWLSKKDVGGLRGCIDSAEVVPQRLAAVVCLVLYFFEKGEISNAKRLLEEEIARDDANPVEHGWLQSHLAHCYLESGNMDEASKLALSVYKLHSESRLDPTVRALAASAGHTLFSANIRDPENLEKVVKGNDTTSSWWRSQSLVTGLTRHFDEAFEQWAGVPFPTNYLQDEAWGSFRSVMIQAGISANRDTWKFAASLLARREFIDADGEDSLVGALRLLRLSGNTKVLEAALHKIGRAGLASVIVASGADLDFDNSTRTSLRADINFVKLSADSLNIEDCDRHARWGLAHIGVARELKQDLNLFFDVEFYLLEMLCALVLPCSKAVRAQMIDYLVSLPPVEQSNPGVFGRFLLCIPKDEWSEKNIDMLRRRESDHPEFQNMLERFLSRQDAQARSELLEKIRSGDLAALDNFGSVSDLPTEIAAVVVEQLTREVSLQVESAENGSETLDQGVKLHGLVLVNLCHADVADWSSVYRTFEATRFHPSRLVSSINLLEYFKERVSSDVRDKLRPLLEGIADRETASNSKLNYPDNIDVRGDALVALGTLFPESIKDSFLYENVASPEPVLRAVTARLLAIRRSGSPSDIAILAVLARDKIESVCQPSIEGLSAWVASDIGLPASESMLLALLKESGPQIGVWASRAWVDKSLSPESVARFARLFYGYPSAVVQARVSKAVSRWL